MKSGQLASVCHYWKSVITIISHLWSTLRVGTWTEREQVATWLQRAYPKKVVIDTQRDGQGSSNALPFIALKGALSTTNQWHELTISSFPPENSASQLGIRVASQMKVLKVLHVEAGCVYSPSFAHLLSLVPTGAPLSELSLRPSFASTHFLQPHWFPVLQNLTALIVNGRDMHRPFELLPTFSQLQIFEADNFPLPFYGSNSNLPLLRTLQKLRLRASSVQWMAGRVFPCLEECVILLPHHWQAVQQLGVQLPTCGKLTYDGYPMSTVQYFYIPQMREMELRSHDCKEQRVYRQLHRLCTLDARISKLTVLHLTLQCSEQVLIRLLRHMRPLQDLVLSIAYPSCLWQNFLESLAAKPSTEDWLKHWGFWWVDCHQWERWCASQTWHVNVLPHLKYLGIRCPKGFSQSMCLNNLPLLRLVGWTRAQLIPPLEHLKVWDERGTTDNTVVDYATTSYMDKHLGISGIEYDSMIVIGMVTQRLLIHDSTAPLFQLHSTSLFRLLKGLKILGNHDFGVFSDHGLVITILSCLEQIKRLEISNGIIPADSFIDLPLMHTLQSLHLDHSTCSWMHGRTFTVLRRLQIDGPSSECENQSRLAGPQVCLPACTTLGLRDFPLGGLLSLFCPNVQHFHFEQSLAWPAVNKAPLKILTDFLHNCPCLKKLEIIITEDLGPPDPLIQLVFSDALEQQVWRDIGSVEVQVWFFGSSRNDGNHFFRQVVAHHQQYKRQWKEFKVTREHSLLTKIIVRASV